MKKWIGSVIAALAVLAPSASFWTEFPQSGSRNPASGCQNLPFWTIKPETNFHPANLPCDRSLDKSACDIRKAFDRIRPVTDPKGRKAYALTFANDHERDRAQRYLEPLTRSPAIREMNRLRIEARALSGYPDVCEPNLIYLGKDKVFGMGPVFVDSTRVMIGSKPYASFIAAEDASLFRVSIFSKDKLMERGYYDLAIAHELAHAVMQDLYGLETFSRVAASTVSRDGHMASVVTDPVIALIEGFAEGFEAYLGEKAFGRNTPFQVPLLRRVMREANTAADFFEARGWKGYLLGALPFVSKSIGTTLLNFDEFTAEFLGAERQIPIRDNHFILQGSISNLVHQMEMMPAFVSDPELDALIGYEVESYDALFSKEGVIAHLIYSILKADLHREMFEIIERVKPRGSHEFVSHLLSDLPAPKLAKIAPAINAIFTPAGRNANRDYLRISDAWRRAEVTTPEFLRAERELARQLSAIPLPRTLGRPKELWVEFSNDSFFQKRFFGRMDRINLFTASPNRILAFLKSTQPEMWRKTELMGRLHRAVLAARSAANGTAADLERTLRLNPDFRHSGKIPVAAEMMDHVIRGLHKGVQCFKNRCLSLKN